LPVAIAFSSADLGYPVGAMPPDVQKFGRTIGTSFPKIRNCHLAKCPSDWRCATLFATPPDPGYGLYAG
jgi:hypothetical protein